MKKRIITVAVILAILGICIAGGTAAIHYRQGTVVAKVYPVSLINSGYWGDQMSSYGTVTNDFYQEIELDSGEVPDKIYVSVGDKVKTGDKILKYDTTMESMDLKLKQYEISSIEKKIALKEAEIEKLKTVTPVAQQEDPGGGYDWDDTDDTDTTDDTDITDDTDTTGEIPEEKMVGDAYCYLDDTAEPYRGNGTKKNPYRFICTEDAVMSGGFINTVAGFDAEGEEMTGDPQIVLLEVHKDNLKDGKILMSFSIDGTTQTEVDKKSVMKLSFLIHEKKNKNEKDETKDPTEGDASLEGDNTDFDYDDSYYDDSYYDDSDSDSEDFETSNVLDGLDYGEDAAGFLQYDTLYDPEQSYTKEEIDDMIEQDTEDINELKMEKKEAKIEVRKLKQEIKNATVYSEVDGIVKSMDESQLKNAEESDAAAGSGEDAGEYDDSFDDTFDEYDDSSFDDSYAGTSSDAFMVISGSKGLYIKGTLSEFMLEDVDVGQTIYATSWESGASVEAEIESISEYPSLSNDYMGEGNTNTSYYPFVASVDEESGLNNGETVEISMVVGGSSSMENEGIYLTKAFLRSDNGRYYVYKRGADKKLEKTYVKTGKMVYGTAYEILDGVTQDDWLAFPYGSDAKEGVRTEEDEDGTSLGY